MAALKQWRASAHHKPLIVGGARQVGKTWLVREFAHEEFASLSYVNFLGNEVMRSVFAGSIEPERLLSAIGAYTRTNPMDGNTLVFLDEIQECPRAITSLKMFCERYPNVPIVAAGSLLGVAVNREDNRPTHDAEQSRVSWPVGKVEYLDMHPMTFLEFLMALGEEEMADLIDLSSLELVGSMGEKYNDLLRTYFYIGGMPEAVQAYVDSHTLLDARTVQSRLLRDYEHDFSKHVESPLETARIREVWRSVPTQIARESGSNKFIYAQVKSGGRGRDYRDAVSWLANAGLVTKVMRVSKPGIPLKSYSDDTAFKLFLLDIGLLGAALGLDERTVVQGNKLFVQAKGAYAEQYVCQQLVASNACIPYYWSADGKLKKAEVDLLYDFEGSVVPVEVKSNKNVTSRSLASFAREYSIGRSLRLSPKGYTDQGWLVNIPLAAANVLPFKP